MLPTLTNMHLAGPDLKAQRVLVDLDELMLVDRSLFALDAGNQRVPGVAVQSLTAGLDLVGRGPVASLVGRLRPQLRVVDVDLVGRRGHAAVEAVAAWCAGEGLWHLVRPSGGADGRGHVYMAVDGHLEALEAFLAGLRAQLRAGPRTIDLRTAVRPLSAPHRTGVYTRPAGDAAAALAALRAALGASAGPGRDSRASAAPGAAQRPPTGRSGLIPQRPTCLPVPPQWSGYLEQGVRPAIGGDDTENRSNYEAIATAVLVRAGRDPDAAWSAVQGAHADAFTKARQRGRAWWARHVWDPAVRAHDRFTPLPQHARPVPEGDGEETTVDVDEGAQELADDVSAARQAVEATAWTLEPRARPAFLLVMHVVLDRMARTGSRRAPVPERDLVLDTGISDRSTIRAQLRRADGPVGVLDRAVWDAGKRDSSSFEFEIPRTRDRPGRQVKGGDMWEILPPSSHTPLPPGVWHVLPRVAHQLWRVLDRCPEPATIDELGLKGQLVATPNDTLSPSQVRAVRQGLLALAQAGLAVCTEGGQWVARRALQPAAAAAGRERHAGVKARIDQERAAYRAHQDIFWDVARAAALKANLAREVAWWKGLPPAARRARRLEWANRFGRLSVRDQQLVKATLADRRIRAGGNERARHDAWLDGLRWEDLRDRSIARSAWFASLPGPKGRAYAAMWAQHRHDYGVPRSTPTATSRLELAAALPHSPTHRDDQFLHDFLPLEPGDEGDTGDERTG